MKRKDINYFIMKHILRTFQPSRYGNKLHVYILKPLSMTVVHVHPTLGHGVFFCSSIFLIWNLNLFFPQNLTWSLEIKTKQFWIWIEEKILPTRLYKCNIYNYLELSSLFQFDIPGLLIQIESIYTKSDNGLSLRHGIKDICVHWNEQNPIGRIIFVQFGSYTFRDLRQYELLFINNQFYNNLSIFR